MDFNLIDELSNENIEELYNDTFFNENENEELLAIYTKSYYYIKCDNRRTGTGWGVTYSAYTCGGSNLSTKNYCTYRHGVQKEASDGGNNHIYNLGITQVCGVDEYGYACNTGCVNR